ncbi:MAG: hypothetical protein BM557_10100 [Flavobacterium sp. MedPE-SWcel]|uniref:putative signal transducing protein n=1 Tax=uncultured Flavobacterium sp. TaxID=165435 RepID=UPI0009236A2A|nr:DUF2007 domain-containing protein [uncultured Flavobacterium sp.]OIQ16214.1 MAG: hypothetical protein BM557_10100 [Flavobacterium sp. MedPE-SWcel]
MGMMKVFSGSNILAQALKLKLEEAGIDTIIKNNVQSATMAGFGSSGQAVEIFIDERFYGKAHKTIEDFKMSI